jgi:uncharacterized protein YegP (UPF0339 family)
MNSNEDFVKPCEPISEQEQKPDKKATRKAKKAQKKALRLQKKAQKQAEKAKKQTKGNEQCLQAEAQSREGILPTEEYDQYSAAQEEPTAVEQPAAAEENAAQEEPVAAEENAVAEEPAIIEEPSAREEPAVIEAAEAEPKAEKPSKYFTDITGKLSRFEIFLDKSKAYRFNMIAGNGEIVGVSQGYKSKASCKTGVNSVIKHADAPVADTLREDYSPKVGKAVFEVYKGTDNKFRFRLRASNFRPILASQGYTTKANCLKGIASVKNIAAAGNITDLT